MTQKWPEKMTKTRQEMTALGLPGGRKKDGATVVEDTISAQDRWTTTHDLIFRLPDMPDNLAYSTWYREGSTEQQDESPWEYEDAECVLVRKVPKVVEAWTAEPVHESEQVPSPITYVPVSAARQIRNTIYRNCDAERERQIEKGYDAAHDDDHADGDLSGLAAAVAAQDARVAHSMLRDAAQHILDKWPGYADRIRIAHALLTADLERLARAKGQPEPRIEVARIDPNTLIGIAPCDDGSPGWVVLASKPNPDEPGSFILASLADEADPLGEIVYVDILDAAEVLKTGIVWKHDMGEDEGTDDPDSGPLDATPTPAT